MGRCGVTMGKKQMVEYSYKEYDEQTIERTNGGDWWVAGVKDWNVGGWGMSVSDGKVSWKMENGKFYRMY